MDLSEDLIEEYSIVSSDDGLEDSDDREIIRESFGVVEVDLVTNLGMDIVEEDDDLAVTNTLEGVGDFFDMYCLDGIQKDEDLISKWSKRMAMEDLSGGNRGRRRREWWLGICYVVATDTGIPINKLGADDIKKQ